MLCVGEVVGFACLWKVSESSKKKEEKGAG